jgi:protein-S-isoprenylcysteine O-methyltransferase Ste14
MTTQTSQTKSKTDTHRGVVRWAGKMLISFIFYGAVLFLSAGRLSWREGLVYFGVLILTQVVSALVLIPNRPDLLAERSKVQEGTKSWDRILAPLAAMVGPLVIMITAGLDARLGWSAPISDGLWIAGVVLAFLSGMFILWAMASNPFFASTVRIQEDRGQSVSQDGPYRIIRHPGYLGSILFDLVSPLALGSLWTYLPVAITVALLILRTGLEDQTLRAELPGYQQYAARVRQRLFPGVW